jgi:hypothetical protein
VIVREDRGARIDGECRSHDFPRVDARTVYCADEEPLAIKNSVAVVEPHDVEFFVEQCAKARSEVVACVARISDAAFTFELRFEDVLGSFEHVLLSGASGEFVVAVAVADKAHVFSPRRWIAPWAFRKQNGKGMQHPKTIAWRSVEGGNVVDEGDALAQDDVKRRWPTTGASRCRGEPQVRDA